MIFIKEVVRRKTGLLFLLCFFVGQVLNSQDYVFPPNEEKMVDIPVSWQQISQNDVIPSLQMLLKISEGTCGRISTISGVFSVEYEEVMSGDYLFGEGLSSVSEHIQLYDFLLRFCVEKKRNRSFYAKQVLRQIFTASGKDVTPNNVVIMDENTIIADGDYVYTKTSPGIVSAVAELPDFPNLTNKRVAWCESVEGTKTRTLVDFIDPFEYFDTSKWASLDSILDILVGKYGEDKKIDLSESISLFQTTDKSGKKWFRYLQRIILSRDPLECSELNVFWNEESGFHPVCRVYASSSSTVINLLQLQWKLTDGLYYPVESLAVVYRDDGTLSYRRKMKTSDLVINEPTKEKQFAYSALGLGDGDVLVDRIKQQVFTIKNDKPVFLAKFYEKYKTSDERVISRFRLVTMGLGIVLIIIGLFLIYLRKRKNRLQT